MGPPEGGQVVSNFFYKTYPPPRLIFRYRKFSLPSPSSPLKSLPMPTPLPSPRLVTLPYPFTKLGQEERFLSRHSPPTPSGCRLWTGARDENAGILSIENKTRRAHRVAYEYHYGPIPPDHQILQTCKNPLCLTKEHLYLSPNPVRKTPLPTKQRALKFTPDQILRIRRDRIAGSTLQTIADRFFTTPATILNICRGKIYSHVPFESSTIPQQLP